MHLDEIETIVNHVTYVMENPLIRDGLKATLTALDATGKVLHSDRINLDSDRARTAHAKAAGVDPVDLLTVRSHLAEYLATPPPDAVDLPAEPSAEALEAAIALLEAPDQLDQRATAVTALGYAGDTGLVKVLDLVMASRLLPRPLNLVVRGPSSAGKSFIVDLVGRIHPPAAVYHLVGMSERALIYTDADLQNRHLVLGELRALERTDSFAATVLRALAWEGHIVYETVQKTADGLKPLRIEKPGPTGFISTTTGGIDPELETRVLSVYVPDTPETTRLILQASAGRANGHAPEPPDLEPFHAAGWWLETEGGREVTIPYAGRLADLVPDHLVRMRRDFTQILTLIQAHALLYQRQRDRDDAGRIIADERDYDAVYALVADLFGTIAAEGVTPAIRQTVEALVDLTPNPDDTTSYRRLSEALGIDVAACRQRCAAALRQGWIVNLEDKRGRPARLRPGDAMPATRTALPESVLLFSGSQPHSLQESASASLNTCENAQSHRLLTTSQPVSEPVSCEEVVRTPNLTGFAAYTSLNDTTCEVVSREEVETFPAQGFCRQCDSLLPSAMHRDLGLCQSCIEEKRREAAS